MGSIYKRGGIWYIDVRASGRRVRKRVGTSKKIAELALKDAEVKIARDEFGFAKNDASIQMFLERFLEYSDANHSKSTYNRYRAVLDHFKKFLALPVGDSVPISDRSQRDRRLQDLPQRRVGQSERFFDRI